MNAFGPLSGNQACPPGHNDALNTASGTLQSAAVRSRRARTGREAPRVRLPIGVVLAVVLVGGLQRWWVATHPIGTLTSDSAVIGLMAVELLHHGQLATYMWGQAYGGSLEAVLTAVVFAIAGVGTSQLLATTALSSALCAVALWWAGRRIVGEQAALLAALAFWVWPALFLWRSLKPGGTYMIGLAIALCAVGMLARIGQGSDGWRPCAVAGVLCGLAIWSSPMSLELFLPAALWLMPAVRRLGRRLLVIAAGAVVGGFPILLFGATNDWRNLHMPGYRPDLLTAAPARFAQFFGVEGPIAMGVRVEGSLGWVGGHVGQVLAGVGAAALLAATAVVLTGRAPRCRLPIFTLLLLPVLYAFIPLADHVGQGRYALFAVPMAALLIGVVLERAGTILLRPGIPTAPEAGPAPLTRTAVLKPKPWQVWATGLAAVAVLGTIGMRDEPGRALVSFRAPDVPMPIGDSDLLALLRTHHVRDAYASYWIAYRVTFESQGRTNVASSDYDRYPPMNATVAQSPHPAYLFIASSKTVRSFESWCHEHQVRYRVWRRGDFTVVQPATKITSSMLPPRLLS